MASISMVYRIVMLSVLTGGVAAGALAYFEFLPYTKLEVGLDPIELGLSVSKLLLLERADIPVAVENPSGKVFVPRMDFDLYVEDEYLGRGLIERQFIPSGKSVLFIKDFSARRHDVAAVVLSSAGGATLDTRVVAVLTASVFGFPLKTAPIELRQAVQVDGGVLQEASLKYFNKTVQEVASSDTVPLLDENGDPTGDILEKPVLDRII